MQVFEFLINNNTITTQGFINLFNKNNLILKKLHIFGNFNDELTLEIITTLPNLIKLELKSNKITAKSLFFIFSKLLNLEHFFRY